MCEYIVVHGRVAQRHPELSPADVAAAWGNRVAEATRHGSFGEETVVVGFDGLGRVVEAVGVAQADGTTLVYHAMTPPSKKTLREVGLG